MEQHDRTDITRSAVLDAACQHLWRGDESTLRVDEIRQLTGYSTSVIYSYFRSRQGLVDAAYLEIYRQLTSDLVDVFRHATADAASAEDLKKFLSSGYHDLERRTFWADRRRMRMRVATAALSRRSMREEFSRIHSEYMANVTTVFAELQRRGVAGTHLSARQIAATFEGILLYHAINDVVENSVDDDGWLDVMMAVVGSFPAPS